MRKKRKIIITIILAMIILSLLSGCAKKGNCDECGQYETLNEFVERNGTTHWYCDTCYRLAKLFY